MNKSETVFPGSTQICILVVGLTIANIYHHINAVFLLFIVKFSFHGKLFLFPFILPLLKPLLSTQLSTSFTMNDETNPSSYLFYEPKELDTLEGFHHCLGEYIRKVRQIKRIFPAGPPIPLSLFNIPVGMDLIKLVGSKRDRGVLEAWFNAFHGLRDYALINMPSFRSVDEISAENQAIEDSLNSPPSTPAERERMDEDEAEEKQTSSPPKTKPKSKGTKRARVTK